MQKLFKNSQVQAKFEQDGYVKLPVLKQDQINALLEFYNKIQLQDEKGYGFHVSMDVADKALVNRIIEKIYELALPSVLPHFEGAKPYIASFVIKESNPKGIVPVHQDWTFVEDELQHNSVTFWIPLVDVTMENGALGLIKGSHRFFEQVRPSPSPQVKTPLEDHLYSIFPYLNIVEMKAGEGLVFDNRTFHASPPNTTSDTRIAIGIGLTQKEAQLCHYFLKPDSKEKQVLKYRVDEQFFRDYDNAKLSNMYENKVIPEGYELIETASYEINELTSQQLVEKIQQAGNTINTPLITRLAYLFSQPESPKSEPKKEEETAPEPKLPFWKIYTPMNILREIKYRLGRGNS